MTLHIVRAAARAEVSDDIHVIRMLIILGAANLKMTTKTIQGITKLAKIDFLLRYPNCLQRALAAEKKDCKSLNITFLDFELSTIESKMIRFRYGPWDERYRRWLGILVAKGLAETYVKGKAVCIEITDTGKQLYDQVIITDEFSSMANRCKTIFKVFGAFSATRLMKFIYATFPELTNMKWGNEIEL